MKRREFIVTIVVHGNGIVTHFLDQLLEGLSLYRSRIEKSSPTGTRFDGCVDIVFGQ